MKQFRRDYKKLQRVRGADLAKLDAAMRTLIRKEVLGVEYHDHALRGEWTGCHDCHIEGDWILIYELGVDTNGKETITFHATGNHEYLFG